MNLAHVAGVVSEQGSCTFVARGQSMTPLIKDGQSVTVVPVDPKKVRKGDIVLARVRGDWYLHKVTATNVNRVQISNNHGHINGWTPRMSVVGRLKK